MVTKFRNATKSWFGRIIVGFFFGVIALSFALWGIGDIFRGDTNPVVAEVGDGEIKFADLNTAFTQTINDMERRFGQRINPAQAQAFGLLSSSLNQLVNRQLLREEANDLGLGLSDAAVAARIQSNPAFRDAAGNYSAESLRTRLRNAGVSEAEFVESERVTAIFDQLFGSVAKAAYGPKAAIDVIARYDTEQRSMNWVLIPADAEIADPGDEELQTFLESDDGRQFERPEYRQFDLIQIDAADIVEEGDYTEDDLLAEYESVKGSLGTPEQRRVDQISFADEATADSALQRLRNGEDFAAVALDTAGLQETELSLGLVQFRELPEDYARAAFALPLNTVSEPVKTALGWRLFRVTEIIPGNAPGYAEVRESLVRDVIAPLAEERFYELTRDIEDKLAGGDSLAEVASALGLPLDQVGNIAANGQSENTDTVTLKNQAEILRTAFTTDEGTDSGVIETEDGLLYVLQVQSVTPAAVPELAEIRDEVLGVWRSEEQASAALSRAETLMERVNGGEKLEDIARQEGLTLSSTQLADRFALIGAAPLNGDLQARMFTTAKGEAFVGQAADSNAQVLAVTTLIEPGTALTDKAAIDVARDRLQQGLENDIMSAFSADLNNKHGVEINQDVIDLYFSADRPVPYGAHGGM